MARGHPSRRALRALLRMRAAYVARKDLQPQRMHREVILLVGPGRGRAPAGIARERAEGVDRVLVGVLGVDRLTHCKLERVAGDRNALALQAFKMHLDTLMFHIVERAVAEAR